MGHTEKCRGCHYENKCDYITCRKEKSRVSDKPLLDRCDICDRAIIVRITKYGIPIRNSVRFDIDTGKNGCRIETWTLCEECISKVRNLMSNMIVEYDLVKGEIR